ncbi:hypothetical protein C725_1370 [Pacificimonas flava]|uniref:Uncharacterized protein n=1 Tax=Pacificimonas flava TaxID=1234595 RepID=M2TA54_9SPHN|nr:hypothetical protein C725_1370 [Pacificimonas flava]
MTALTKHLDLQWNFAGMCRSKLLSGFEGMMLRGACRRKAISL